MSPTVPPTEVSALLTDLYQLTMAYGYWHRGLKQRRAVFHLFFRNHPFGGGFAVAAGLAPMLEMIRNYRFSSDELDYLSSLTGSDGRPLFEPAFLNYLADLRLDVDVDAMLEGTVAFAHEPLMRVEGPLLHCQLLETALLNTINFQTLIATKASRICRAAEGDDVLEFGLRRAQGIDGSLAASRAAYIGGATATSNVLAGKRYGIPVRGTHAHSWVMSFDDELTAFKEYAVALPNNCVFLVDTYDTLDGVRHAIEVGIELRAQGHRLVGIRLDSGDLSYLSIEARKLLDAAGFVDAKIVASNDLDERLITSLKHQGAKIGVWGVGTKLVTAYDQPALGGVYKLGAIQDEEGRWQPRVKLSEQLIKVSTPGRLQVRRFIKEGRFMADMIWDELHPAADRPMIVDLFDSTLRRGTADATSSEELLVPCVRRGQVTLETPRLCDARARTLAQLDMLDATILRLDNPHRYPVGLEAELHRRKAELVLQARPIKGTV